MLLAILVAVRDAPPPAFPPSNMWHAMHGDMKGLHADPSKRRSTSRPT
jgi:hypothetical protein